MVPNDHRRALAHSAAAMYGGAAFLGVVEGLAPGGAAFSPVPALIALVVTVLIARVGPRLPSALLAVLGPLGATLIAGSLATTTGYVDAAVLYMWPVLWMSHFYGRPGTVFIVAWIGIVHAAALLTMPPEVGNVDRWIDVMVSVVIVGAVTRILTERHARVVQRLAAEARSDPLTGLLNRRGLDERLEVELQRSVRDGVSLGVVAFDLDHFKRVNDEHGHEVGDRVLAWVAGVIAEQSRAIDLVARLGGEEFAVVLPGADGVGAFAFAERVRMQIEIGHGRRRPGIPDGLGVTVSAGTAAAVGPVDASPLLTAADTSLYDAKRGGRNRTAGERALRFVAAGQR